MRNSDKDFLGIRKSDDLAKLGVFLQGRAFNYVKQGKKDRKGQPMIGLLFTMPGQQGSKRGIIVCTTQDLYLAALVEVKKRVIRKEQSDEE